MVSPVPNILYSLGSISPSLLLAPSVLRTIGLPFVYVLITTVSVLRRILWDATYMGNRCGTRSGMRDGRETIIVLPSVNLPITTVSVLRRVLWDSTRMGNRCGTGSGMRDGRRTIRRPRVWLVRVVRVVALVVIRRVCPG
jgi:hypothetical protein